MSNHAQNIDLAAAMSNLPKPGDNLGPRGIDHAPGAMGTRLNGDGSSTTFHHKPMSASSGDRPTGANIFSDIRDRAGTPLSVHTMTEASVVTVEGVGPMALTTALSAGFVARTPDGRYVAGPEHPTRRGLQRRK